LHKSRKKIQKEAFFLPPCQGGLFVFSMNEQTNSTKAQQNIMKNENGHSIRLIPSFLRKMLVFNQKNNADVFLKK